MAPGSLSGVPSLGDRAVNARRVFGSIDPKKGSPSLARWVETGSPVVDLDRVETVKRANAGIVAFVLAVSFLAALSTAPTGVVNGVRGDSTVTAAELTSAAGGAGLQFGAYEWNTSTWWPNASTYLPTLTRLRALGVNTLYVDITLAVSLTRAHSPQLAPFLADFAQLVAEADARGFHVDAVGGDPTWSKRPKGPAELLAAVARVTAQLPAGALAGVQFDVEPWGLPGWRRHATVRAIEWLRFVQATVSTWKQDGLAGSLGFTVPYWFNGANGAAPKVTFAGSTGYPFQLSLGLLASLPETNLNVMAYRNSTGGPNGSEALFEANLALLVAAGSNTSLLLGQETGQAKPPSITFFGLGCAAFQTAAAQIDTAFGSDANFAGIPVDDVETLLALCPP